MYFEPNKHHFLFYFTSTLSTTLLSTVTPQPVFVDNNEKYKHKFMVQSYIAPNGKTNIDRDVSESSVRIISFFADTRDAFSRFETVINASFDFFHIYLDYVGSTRFPMVL